jgi:hypothetical protein
MKRMLKYFCECTTKTTAIFTTYHVISITTIQKTWHSNLFLWNVFRRSKRISVVNVTIICILFRIILHKLLIYRENTAIIQAIKQRSILHLKQHNIFSIYIVFRNISLNKFQILSYF